jgi:hypothetical protein
MAGLDATSGATKWVHDGVTWLCLAGFHHQSRDGIGQRCRQSGFLLADPSEGSSYRITGAVDLAVAIEVFDLATGATIGTPLPLTLPAGFMDPSVGDALVVRFPPVDVDADHIAALTPAGLAALDLRTGAVTPVSPELAGWCAVEGVAFALGDETRYPGDFTRPCVVGSREPAASVPAPVARVGVHAGGSFVWSDGTSVSAIPSS